MESKCLLLFLSHFVVSHCVSTSFEMACRRQRRNEKKCTTKIVQLLKLYTINSKLITKKSIEKGIKLSQSECDKTELRRERMRWKKCWTIPWMRKNVPSQIVIELTEGKLSKRHTKNRSQQSRVESRLKEIEREWFGRSLLNVFKTPSKQMKHKWKPKTATKSIDRTNEEENMR